MKIKKSKAISFGILFVIFLMTIGNATAGSERNSVIYEDRIVWQDDSNGNWDIQMYNISTSTETQITNNEAEQQNPDIYGDRIVWQDDISGNWNIQMYDISSQKEIRITTNGSNQINPAIYGDKIVWQDSRNGNQDIYMYDLSNSTETQITHNSSDQTEPDIYADRIVWVEDGTIYMYNISTSTETRVTRYFWGSDNGSGETGDLNHAPFIYGDRIVSSAETMTGNYLIKLYDLSTSTEQFIGEYDADSSNPAIYGNRIVWEDGRKAAPGYWNRDIYMYDLSTSRETQITTNESSQGDPAIYGNRVVWTDERNAITYNDMSDIYMYDISTSKETRITTVAEEPQAQGTETRITSNEEEQEYPAIYGDRIVWRDWRNGNQHDFKNGDIYMYNISTSTETQITTNKSCQVNSDIYGDRIVWADDRNGNWDIYMYEPSTSRETQITTNKSDQFEPAIYGDRIVWLDQRNGYPNNDIYMYDLSTHKETQITTNGSNQQSPKIYGDKIIWEDWRNGDDYNINPDIYMYDLSTSREIQITTDGSYQGEPAIYKDRIVWTDQRRLGGWDIYMYNLSTSTETRITARGEGDKHAPAIYEDRIVWHENRKLNEGELGWDIYMYNLSTATETQISTSWSASDPAIYGDRIVWHDSRNGSPDIYMFTILGEGSTQPPVANFSASPLSGKAPLKVKFTSTSIGSPTAWKWNFGDGSDLVTEQNPEYTYSKAGIYTVKHTAINEYGRDTEIKTSYITVTSPLKAPVADFSASKTLGNVPLAVKFTDKSTNNPATWKWNFGDGSNLTTEYNPTHTYSKAGIYTVKETVSNAAGKDTEIKTKYITVTSSLKAPVAAFSASPVSGKAPLKVQFTDKSTNNPASWKWSFGDGTYSTARSPAHTYSKAGKYTVSLTVKNAKGSNTKTMSGYIVVSKK